jgi:DNA polymerase (family X)
MVSVRNAQIAEMFTRLADLLEIEEANPFRVRAYRNAARIIAAQSKSVADMVNQGAGLTDLPGIGKDLAEKIRQIVTTGVLVQLQEMESQTPPELTRLMRIAGLGPKKVKVLYTTLGITSVEALKKAAEEEKIRELKGFGQKTEERILAEIGREKKEKRFELAVVEEIAETLVTRLKESSGVIEAVAAGSYRRRQETVADLDLLVSCKRGSRVMDEFVQYEQVEKVISKGETRSTVSLRSDFHVDLRVVPERSFGAALHYFTGSKAHNIAVRLLGVKKGLKINEYGVLRGDRWIAGRTEADVYRRVDLPYIEPELRENRGEIEAAQKGELPRLVQLNDIRGDLHVHTKDTDGRNSLEQMVEAARERGYEYLSITNHTKHVTVARGLSDGGMKKMIEKIDRLNEAIKGLKLLKSAEVDILEDGSLDLPDDILKEMDLVVCSVHYKFNLSREMQTERVLRAMENPYFDILAHPTGRLINKREAYQIDLERVVEAARQRGCFLELNAYPDRLDLSDAYCKMAKEMGVRIAISTDAHSLHELDFMRFGIGQARRGWLEPGDVLNTRPWDQLKKLLRRR